MERMRPVIWETKIVAGDMMSLSDASVSTALLETMTVTGPPGERGGVEAGVG